MSTIWSQVVAKAYKDKRHVLNDVANDLTDDEITTILATAEFFGASDVDLHQIVWDLKVPKYRVFDWLGMCVMGRIDCRATVQVFAHSFLKSDGDVDAFIADLRETDYDVDYSWEGIEL
jgi:hypothetical protein